MCGGGGPSGETKYNWNDTMAPKWNATLQNMEFLASQPYRQYGGQRIANLNNDQNTAMQYGRNIANMSSNPIPAMDAARDQITGTLGGEYLTGSKANPFASASNPYAGMDNPAFNQMLQNSMRDVTDAYDQGTRADTTRMAVLSGAFGGDAHQKKMANNESALAKQLGNLSSSMRSGQYDRSAQLEENFLNRGAQSFDAERNRMMGAIGSGQNEQGLAYQRMQQLMGVGDIGRSLDQDQLNLAYQNWQNAQNHPYQMMDWQTGIYSRAQGGMSPNMTTSQSGYAASPFSQLLGAGLLGYGMMN